MASTKGHPLQEQIILSLDGDSITSADLLVDAISSFQQLISLSADAIAHDIPCQVNISALQQGSFKIVFEIAENVIEFVKENLSDIASISTILTFILEVKSHLGNKHAKSISQNANQTFNITNNSGGIIVISPTAKGVIENPNTDKAVTQFAKTVRSHNPNGGFSITSGKTNKTTRFEKQDVSNMLLPFDTTDTIQSSLSDVLLSINKPVLKGNAKWDVQLNDKAISVAIEDKEWLKQVHQGTISFAAGDAIKVKLRSEFSLNALGAIDNNSVRYFVVEVYETIKNTTESQISLF